ncbi:MAG: hypothetical protein J5966_05495, partial [Lachnospiraceae bacterium]|nr:hypothetical protein [Lachnospiraceae bacterium]
MLNEMMKSQPKVRLSKVLLMLCLSAAIVMGTMPCAPFVMTARADDTEKTIICLGADVLSVNCATVGAATVYYGKHEVWEGSEGLAWRVINYNGKGALFNGKENNLTLFAVGAIGSSRFSGRTDKNNKYGDSELKTEIDNIYSDDFTETEKSAIKKRELLSGDYDGLNTDCIGGDPLTGDAAPNLWPLSAKEANVIYSRVNNTADNYLHDDKDWWLRSPGKDIIVSGMDYNVYSDKIDYDPGDTSADVYNANGVRPAFNIGLDSIISTSLISGTKGEPGAKYKLTILDSDLSVSVNNVSKSNDNTFTVDYTITDNSSITPTQLSVIVTDGNTTWTENGWSCSQSGENISYLQYTKLDVENFSLSGTGTFTLGSSISGTWGEDYHVYILAEDVNGGHETDYASPPMEILDSSAVWASAADQEFTYDGNPHGITVNVTHPASGVTVRYGESVDNYTLDTSPTITNVSESPKTIYYKAEANGLDPATGFATVTINKAESAITKAPSAKTDLKYTGEEQALVNAGTVTGGTLYYAVTTENTAPAGSAYTAA